MSMKPRLFLLACVLATIFSCKKSNESNPVAPPPIGPTREVQLKLSGDLSVTESPLGRKVKGASQNARTLNDSTIYVVEVAVGSSSVFRGLFNRPDSILIRIPVSGTVTVGATAFKRGSGGGLYYTWDIYGHQYFPYPIEASLLNRMDTSYGYYQGGVDTLSYLPVFNPEDTTAISYTLHSELDTYKGQVSFTGSSAPPVITIPMKRIVFGIRYNVSNFNGGRLIADFDGRMPAKYLTPSDAFFQQYIYTADELQWSDSLYYSAVDLTMKWEKPGGGIVVLGAKKVHFKRNVLTNINVRIPADGAVVNPIPLDSNWIWNEEVDF